MNGQKETWTGKKKGCGFFQDTWSLPTTASVNTVQPSNTAKTQAKAPEAKRGIGFGVIDMTFDEALKSLKDRFPNGDLESHPQGQVFISLPLKTGSTFRAGLTWQQAKYLASNELTGDDLKDQHFPLDWPT